jgi:DNA-binding response OmpR family regulator
MILFMGSKLGMAAWRKVLDIGIAEKTIVKGRPEGVAEDHVACGAFRILVIEDEVRLRKLLVRELSAEGFEVWEAVDGKTGLQIVADGPNLVLLDLRLPDMDGLQVLRAVRRMRDNLPIVVLSRIGDEDAKVEALDLGADDYVMKPFGIKELLARIRVALRHRGHSPTENRCCPLEIWCSTLRNARSRSARKSSSSRARNVSYSKGCCGMPVRHLAMSSY